MKRILYIFAIFASLAVYAQSGKKPLVIIDGMLASQTLIENDTKNIVSMDVYKSAATIPQDLKSFEKLNIPVISVKVKEMYYDRIALEALNNDFKLPANNPVYFDGNLIENTKLIVIANALENMEVQVINGNKFLSLNSFKKSPSPNAIR